MNFDERNTHSDEYRREELIRKIERSLQNLTLAELEALSYSMSTQTYSNDEQ